MSIVIKTDRNRHDSKFHEYEVTSNFFICFKNVLWVASVLKKLFMWGKKVGLDHF